MNEIKVKQKHNRSVSEAMARVSCFLEDLARDEGIKSFKEPYGYRIKGTGIEGQVKVEKNLIDINVDLSLLMKPFTSTVKKTIDNGINKYFNSDENADIVSKPNIETNPSSDVSFEIDSYINAKIESYQLDKSLPRDFYTDPKIFEADIKKVFRKIWLYADHESKIPNPGDYFLYSIGSNSIIIIRQNDYSIKALHNTCRHRGSTICQAESGNAITLRCPYHAWVYEKDGKLIDKSARVMPEEFKPREHDLRKCAVEVVEGLIYINLDENPIKFENVKSTLKEYLVPHGFSKSKIASQEKYIVNANWKLVTENFLECYHCVPTHPEYCSVNAHAIGNSIGDQTQLQSYQDYTNEWNEHRNGFMQGVNQILSNPLEEQTIVAYRQPIKQNFKTLSQGGLPVAPLMGSFKDYDGGETVIAFGPIHFISAANDYASIFRFTPIDVNKTEVILTWLVREDAEEGKDYDLSKVKWMWEKTTIQDKKITEDNQTGINSDFYTPGFYSMLELTLQRFVLTYFRLLKGK